MNYRVLLLCNFQKNTAETIIDHINSFTLYSKHQVDIFDPVAANNVTEDLLTKYHAVIIHYSLAVVFDYYLSPASRYCIKNYNGAKIMFIQDEYRWINQTIDCMNALRIDTVFTSVPEQEITKVYPPHKFPNTNFINNLTGYVPERFLKDNSVTSLPSYQQRNNDVVYRGRKLSAAYGKLVLEKYEIAAKFAQHTSSYDLKLDLAAKEEDRIYGEHWLNFIKNSKAALGTESGASVFDFEDNIRKLVADYETKYPDASYEEIEAKFFSGLDGKIKLNQISPRVFESMALKTLLVLYEGEYSNVIQPWVHYIPLKKDFSNIAEVVVFIQNEEKWQQIVDRAFNDIILSGKYSYKAFIEQVDEQIDNLIAKKSTAKAHDNKAAMVVNKKGALPSKLSNFIEAYTKKGLRYLARKFSNKFVQNLIHEINTVMSVYFYRANLFLNHKNRSVVICKNSACCGGDSLIPNRYKIEFIVKRINKFEICPDCKWYIQGYNL